MAGRPVVDGSEIGVLGTGKVEIAEPMIVELALVEKERMVMVTPAVP